MTYADKVILDGRDLEVEDHIEEFLRGIGDVHITHSRAGHSTIYFKVAVVDLWDACERAEEIAIELNSLCIYYQADRSKVRP